MTRAQTVVNILLEDDAPTIPVRQQEPYEVVRVCAMCEQEKGRAVIGPGQKPSHGLCPRHYQEAAKEYGISPDRVQKVLDLEASKPPFWHDTPR
jgi:hypothetical protein